MGDLLGRVEAAAGPDRKIDRDLMSLDHSVQLRAGVTRWVHNRTGAWGPATGTEPEYTASLDATLALVERVLPGLDKDIWSFGERGWGAALTRPEVYRVRMSSHAYSPTPALALLVALLRALTAQGALQPALQKE